MQLGAGGPHDMNGPCPQRPGYDGHSSFTQQDGPSRGLNHMLPQQQQQQQQSMNQNPNCNKSLGPPHAPINGVPPPPMMPGFYPMHGPYNNTQLNMVVMYMIPKGSVMGQTPVSSTNGPGENAGPRRSDELRLTFPIRDGVLLPPFRIEPNRFVSKQSFVIWAPLYKWLKSRSDIELHLKCFLLGDREMSTNWPTSVSVMVNTTLLTIERGDNMTSHKPLALKNVCQIGENTIQITTTPCCCSHLFILQLVYRPSVRSVLQCLSQQCLLPCGECIIKLKCNFWSVANDMAAINVDSEDEGVKQRVIKVGLKCPITSQRITLPARGQDCKHIQCFDLE